MRVEGVVHYKPVGNNKTLCGKLAVTRKGGKLVGLLEFNASYKQTTCKSCKKTFSSRRK